jgi:malonyl-CoA O-methyltransferase
MHMQHAPDKALMRRAFERAAASYDGAARLQREVCTQLGATLHLVGAPPHYILDAGSGTGFGTAVLRGRYPAVPVVELDIAHAMVCLSRAKHGGPFGVCGDIERLPLAAQSFDLVFSSLALQWAVHPERAFAELRRVLRPGGWLLFSTLGMDTLWEMRAAFNGVDPHSHINRFNSAAQIQSQMHAAGLTVHTFSTKPEILRYATVRAIMHDLKAIGAHNVTGTRPPGLMGKARWRQVTENYEARRSEQTLPATYEVIYVAARRID